MENTSLKVSLEGIRFFACHGVYEEEQLTGNEFFVDVHTEFLAENLQNDTIENTVNYERLFSITESEMKQTKKLIETVAFNILQHVKREFSYLDKIKVIIRKMNPPFSAQVKCSVIELNYNR